MIGMRRLHRRPRRRAPLDAGDRAASPAFPTGRTSPERAFTERTAAAIMVLLGFLILMNAVAVYFRKRFERKW